jgi:hypothetical protein
MWECAMLFPSVRPSCPRSTLRWNLCSHSLFTPLSSHPSSALHVILFTLVILFMLSPFPPFLLGPLYISPPAPPIFWQFPPPVHTVPLPLSR